MKFLLNNNIVSGATCAPLNIYSARPSDEQRNGSVFDISIQSDSVERSKRKEIEYILN